MKFNIKDKQDLSKADALNILELLFTVWPPKDGIINLEEAVNGYVENINTKFHKVVLCYSENQLAGYSEIFNRDVIINSQTLPVMALAGVCVDTAFRGENIGYDLVKNAFGFVDNGTFKISLFQTNIPKFYYKLNCKLLNNQFINSQNPTDKTANPWRDPHVMIYPDTYDIGNAVIDLNGGCY